MFDSGSFKLYVLFAHYSAKTGTGLLVVIPYFLVEFVKPEAADSSGTSLGICQGFRRLPSDCCVFKSLEAICTRTSGAYAVW